MKETKREQLIAEVRRLQDRLTLTHNAGENRSIHNKIDDLMNQVTTEGLVMPIKLEEITALKNLCNTIDRELDEWEDVRGHERTNTQQERGIIARIEYQLVIQRLKGEV